MSVHDDRWRSRAACFGLPLELFFAERDESRMRGAGADHVYAEGKKVCARCPVQTPCLEYAMNTNQVFGLWGGQSLRQRRMLLRERKRQERRSA